MKSISLYLFLFTTLGISCANKHKSNAPNYEDYISVLLDKHSGIETNTESFIEAKNYLSKDTLNSDSIYFKLNKVQRGIQNAKSVVGFSPLYGVIPPDSEIYAFHTSPGDHLTSEAIESILKIQLRAFNISRAVLIQEWEQHPSEESGTRLIQNLDYSESENVNYIVQEFINNDSTSSSLKYSATRYVLDDQTEIDYKRYMEIIISLEGYLLTDFLLLFKADYDIKNLQKEINEESRKIILNKLEERKLTKAIRNNQNSLNRINKAKRIISKN